MVPAASDIRTDGNRTRRAADCSERDGQFNTRPDLRCGYRFKRTCTISAASVTAAGTTVDTIRVAIIDGAQDEVRVEVADAIKRAIAICCGGRAQIVTIGSHAKGGGAAGPQLGIIKIQSRRVRSFITVHADPIIGCKAGIKGKTGTPA